MGSPSVEFFHKSVGEFLCAERLKDSLVEWTEPGRRGKTFNIDDKQLHEQIYDLLGYGAITLEIVQYLMDLLTASHEFKPVQLFQRLEHFYCCWCEGEFIDAPPENLPQKKMRLLREQGVQLGQRQVDVYAGLNVLILLLELNRYAQHRDDLKDRITFYPSSKLDTENGYTDKLLRIISYSDSIGIEKFNNVVGQFLTGAMLSRANLRHAILTRANLTRANLTRANLTRANLVRANLKRAILIGTKLVRAILREANLNRANLNHADLNRANLNRADLSGADLSGANLSGANLINPDLSRANLTGANLTGANLSRANLTGANLNRANLRSSDLSGANLTGANLSGANLSRANLSRANLENISWDENTKWEDVQGLETAFNVPKALKQQLKLQ
ncbi:MAG: pentapeptide repeat-containing protein [Microcoleus sp. SIO2G3]|nr:pentapeptide repeat-containing protein [Microcoleus sp. SIO2G3]